MKRYIKSTDGYDDRYEVVTVYSGTFATPPDEIDVIESYKGESKSKTYSTYNRALAALKKFTGMIREGVHGGYYGNIPVVREVSGRGDVVAYMDYDGNLVEI